MSERELTHAAGGMFVEQPRLDAGARQHVEDDIGLGHVGGDVEFVHTLTVMLML